MKQMIRLFLSRTPVAWALLLLLLLSSRAQAQVVNDDCSGAVPLVTSAVCTVSVNGTVAGATQSQAPTTACGFGLTTATDVWYSFTATATTHLVTLAPRFAAILDVRDGACGSSTSVFCTTIANSNTAAVPVGGLVSGQTYFIRVYPATNTPPTGISSTFALCIGQGTAAPANDDCAGAVSLPITTACGTPVSGTLNGATQSLPPSATCSVGITSANDVWYSFVASGATQTLTLNSSFFAAVEVRSGTCASSASVFCGPISSGGGLTVNGLTSGQIYFLRVYININFSPANLQFTICLTPGPTPATNDDCINAVVLPVTTGCTSLVSGTISGASQSLPPASCSSTGVTIADDVWYSFTASGATQTLTFNGGFPLVADIRSGTCANSTSVFCGVAFNQPITLSGLTGGQMYFLRLYNNNNIQPVITTFTLCLTPGPTPPLNDDCAFSINIPVTTGCASPTAGTVQAASQSLPALFTCGFASVANDVWYNFTATGATQTLTFSGNFHAVVDVRAGTCASSTSVFCSTTTTFGGQPQPFIVTGLTSGQAYFLRLYANSNVVPINAAFTLCITGPTTPPNDDCAGALPVPVQFGNACVTQTTTDNTAASTSNVPQPGCASFRGADVWFKVIVPPSGILAVRTVIPNIGNELVDTGLSVYSGNCNNLTYLDCDDDSGGGYKSLLNFTGRTPGEELYIRVWGFGGRLGTVAVCVTSPVICAAPTALASANITTTGALVRWQAGGTPAPSTTFTVEYGLQGFAPGTGATISSIATNAQLSGLLPNTAYCFYVRQNCPDGAGTSILVGPVCFTTSAVAACPQPTGATATNLTITGAQLDWQAGGTPAAGTTYTVEYGPQGFVLGSGTTLAGLSGTSFTLTGLVPATDYCYYVRQNCPNPTGSSAFVGPVCFRTLPSSAAVANDDPCGAITLPLTAAGSPLQSLTSTTAGATTTVQPGIAAPCSPATAPQDVWFALTPAAGVTSIRLTISGSAAGTVRLFTAPNCATGPFTLISCRSSGANNTAVGSVTFTGLTAGQRYYLAVSGYGPADTPGAFTLAGAVVSASRVQAETTALLVFPNPSNTGQVTLRLSGSRASSQATLLNALGQVVLTKTLLLGNSDQVLPTRGLATGLYTLRVVVGNEVLTRKVVLE